MGTIITALLLAGIVAAIIIHLLRSRRKNKCASCGCACTACPYAASKDEDAAG